MNWQTFSDWWKQPFSANASASSWFIFTGFILIVIWLWAVILREGGHIISEAE